MVNSKHISQTSNFKLANVDKVEKAARSENLIMIFNNSVLSH